MPETTSRSLYLSAALLIRESFITLEDLYPHLTPSDEDMEKEHKEYVASVQNRISAAKFNNALAMAAPLESKPARPSTSTTETKKSAPPPPEPKRIPNQKLGILVALLSVGAFRPALAILSKFRWMVDAYPEIADLVIRVMKLSVTQLYEQTMVPKERSGSYTQPRPRYAGGGSLQTPVRNVALTLVAPTPPCTSTIEFVYFYPLWTERVPISTTMDDLMDVIEPLMAFVGLQISRDPVFMTKFMRLGRSHVLKTVCHISFVVSRQIFRPLRLIPFAL